MNDDKKAVLYARSATDNNDQIAEQVQAIQNFAKERNVAIGEYYTDVSASGLSLDRPGIKKLIADAKQRLFTEVYVSDMNRITRNESLLAETIFKLESCGIRVVEAR